ncbi:MAG TPA: NAD(P)-dependent oxidoreductase [Polyangiales bacterium]|nr:NAD(P)-dependent oxidoreductase [Polyangiales bacterium]
MLKIGFVGVGRMGSVMLQHVLDAGFTAVLCDPMPEATAPFVAKYAERARVAATPREAAEHADVIEVVVNTNEQLLEACLGPTGVIAGARPNSIVLIHSTVSHDTLKRLSQAAAERSVHLLDAMVSGARGHLSIPNMAVMVGGNAEAFARAKPVMDTYGSLVLHLGPQGAGLDAKLAINALRYVVMAASQEVAGLAEKAGVGQALAQLVAHTESNRFVGERSGLMKVPLPNRKKDAELAQKDLRAAIARGAALGVQLPTAELAIGLMHRLWGA